MACAFYMVRDCTQLPRCIDSNMNPGPRRQTANIAFRGKSETAFTLVTPITNNHYQFACYGRTVRVTVKLTHLCGLLKLISIIDGMIQIQILNMHRLK